MLHFGGHTGKKIREGTMAAYSTSPAGRDAIAVSRREFIARSAGTAASVVGAGAVGALPAGPAGARPAQAQATPRALPASIAEAGKWLRDGSLKSLDLTRAYLACIDRLEPKLNMFLTLMKDEALRTAAERDAELAAGKDRGPLHGVPIVVKDLFEMAGTRTTVGSRAFENRVTDQTATVVRKLLDAGVVVLGKTNMNEFAAGVSGTNAAFGDTHNPWALEHSPGGSSSGTAAAITAGLCLGGPGTDTGGSIRVPASWCGITGIRPSFGLVSLHGVFPRSHSLDTVGPLARTVRDLALLLDAMSGFDPDDRNSSFAQPRESYTTELERGVRGLRFGIVKDYTYRDVDAPVAAAVREAAETFASMGAEIKEIRVEPLEGRLDYTKLFNGILLYEFNQILGERYRNTPNAKELYGPIVQNNIEVGAKVSRADYEERLKERPFLIAQVKAAFEQVDAMLTPALPTVAPLLKASAQDFGRGRQFTIPFSYTALPSVVVPCGFSSEKLPIGLQIVGNHFQETFLLRIAAAFEAQTGFHAQRPPVFCYA
jgi:aspartyl-tRNA(Asn)/glutamyl-tRNA(Gln) amidotransferase subunit A